jgi:hypothetical protein
MSAIAQVSVEILRLIEPVPHTAAQVSHEAKIDENRWNPVGESQLLNLLITQTLRSPVHTTPISIPQRQKLLSPLASAAEQKGLYRDLLSESGRMDAAQPSE